MDIVHVPFKGSAPAMAALLSGDLQGSFETYNVFQSHLKAGKVRVLAVTTPKRTVQEPDVPTLAESGFPGFEAYAWFSVLAPADTSKAVVERLNREINRVLALPEVKEQYTKMGLIPGGGTPEQLDAFIRADMANGRRSSRPPASSPTEEQVMNAPAPCPAVSAARISPAVLPGRGSGGRGIRRRMLDQRSAAEVPAPARLCRHGLPGESEVPRDRRARVLSGHHVAAVRARRRADRGRREARARRAAAVRRKGRAFRRRPHVGLCGDRRARAYGRRPRSRARASATGSASSARTARA